MAWQAVAVFAALQAVLQAVSAPPPPPPPHLRLDAMLTQMADRFFPPDRLVVVSETSGGAAGGASTGVLSDGRWPVIVLGPRNRPHGTDRLALCCDWALAGRRIGAAILVGSSFTEVRRMFSRMRVEYAPLWNRTAAIVLLLTNREQTATLLSWLFLKHVYNVVLVRVARGRVPLYSPLPPRAGVVCDRDVRDLTLVDEWLPAQGVFARGQADVFHPRPSPTAACARCPVRPTRSIRQEDTYQFEMAVVTDITGMILSHLGCAVDVQLHNHSDFPAVDSNTSSWGRIKYGQSDLILRYLWMTHNRTLHFSASTALEMEQLFLYVTGTGVQSNSLAVESLVLVMVIVAAAANTGLDVLRRRLGLGASSASFLAAAFGAWSLYADQPSPASQAAGRGGVWASGWAAWSTLALMAITVNCMRRSQYAMTAIGPREAHAQSLEDLMDSNIPVGIHDYVMYTILEADNSTQRNGHRMAMVKCYKPADIDRCFKRLLASRGRFALMVNPPKLYNSISAASRELVHRINVPFTTAPVVVYFSRDHPLVDAFSRQMARVQVSGLVDQVYLRSMNFGVAERREQVVAQASGPVAISLKMLAPVLRFLGVMLLPLPSLCFLGELLLARLLHRHCHRFTAHV